jgi:hypothetical protein
VAVTEYPVIIVFGQHCCLADGFGQADFAPLAVGLARPRFVVREPHGKPDQEKYWPAIEDAIRARAKNRQARFAEIEKRVGELREGNPVEVLRNRDTVAFLQRRADALAQRSADLKKLAAAWEPLYKTLSPDQKQRMAFLTLYVLHEVRNAAEERTEEEED